MPKKLTQEEFIRRATEKHGGRYDYSRVEYHNANSKVEIICPIHGSFYQRAVGHYIMGYGCPKCGDAANGDRCRKTTEQFISEAKAIHGDRYDFSKVVYRKNRDYITVICPIHGEWSSKPFDILRGHGCPKCGRELNAKQAKERMTSVEDFISRSRKSHSIQYDYTKVVYRGNKQKVEIVCPRHGSFFQNPYEHMTGDDCPKCKAEKYKKPVCGIGINDLQDAQRELAYKVWSNMLRRCYDEKWRHRNPAYAGCTVCEDWLTYSNFRIWFIERYQDGYQLDKDIKVHGNRIYSPETCLLVPKTINTLFVSKRASRGEYPIGVSYLRGKYAAAISKTDGRKGATYIGIYSTPVEAFEAYKAAKEAHIKEIAEIYYKEGKINEEVYLALMRYEVLITD